MNAFFRDRSILSFALSVLLFGTSPVSAENDDRFSKLAQLISYEVREPELDIVQAAVAH